MQSPFYKYKGSDLHLTDSRSLIALYRSYDWKRSLNPLHHSLHLRQVPPLQYTTLSTDLSKTQLHLASLNGLFLLFLLLFFNRTDAWSIPPEEWVSPFNHRIASEAADFSASFLLLHG